jgi:predicted Zn-dependent peptidase
MQEKINTIATFKTNVNVHNSSKPNVQQSQLGVAEELKKFKELLDNGIISQEEFDGKKKQLLEL